ncbi:N-acyl-D-amino-acid deacylase family protein [Sphingosinicella microcystinivorans]|uniref:N-acyl-D-amino-acid deacylase family protein n=1 Tax=Sphingosinicella microcystinivorans TaxID=335406 RepID=UPI0022F3D215|nr:amidohydrolase family protein [Sphingosinicella microcystinivorans]WBX83533.1 amidohydrolase family protein [Sphingosinicella microcystinivorans]
MTGIPNMRAAGAALLLAASALSTPALARDAAYDIVIRGGTIVDGSGLAAYRGDVAIADGHIVAVGDVGKAKAARTIDAAGLVVAPGFINIHSHAEPDGVSTAVNMLTQGVTTEIINADGGGGSDIAKQLPEMAANGLAENIGAYTGFNAVWRDAMGDRDLRPTPKQIASMQAALEKNLKAGAWGVASGLDYRPSYYAKPEEVIEIVSVAKPWRTNFPNHDRLRPEDDLSSFKGMEETVTIGEKAGLVPVITHIKSAGKERGNAPKVLEMVSAATARGAWTAIDIYPYLAGQTMLQAFLVPGWAADGGRDAMLARFRDPKLRPQLVEAAEYAMETRLGGAEGIALPDLGKRLTDIMAEENVRAGEAVLRTLEKDPFTRANMTFGDEADVITFLKYPDTAVACDCGASIKNRGHPRYFGSFPKILGHYVRDTGTITMEDAVRKMSALPAAIIGMVDRGHIAPGMRADVTLFDPVAVRDHATFDAPTLPSDGIRHVIVNGVPALADGAATGAKAGAVLLRDAHMPSRPMNSAAKARAFTASGQSPDYSVAVAAKQGAGERFATGTVKLTDAKSGTVWTADRLGVVQTTKGWASVTAVLKDKAGNRKAATLTLDRADGGAETPVVSVAFGNAPAAIVPAQGAIQGE